MKTKEKGRKKKFPKILYIRNVHINTIPVSILV